MAAPATLSPAEVQALGWSPPGQLSSANTSKGGMSTTLSADQVKALGWSMPTPISADVNVPKPGLLSRVGSDIKNRGANVYGEITNANQNPILSGLKATSEAFSGVGDVVGRGLGALEGGLESVLGKPTPYPGPGAGLPSPVDQLANTKLFREASQYPDQTKGLENVLSGLSAGGNIASNILYAQGGASGTRGVAGALTRTPEQIAARSTATTATKLDSIARDWQAPAKSPIASYNKARAVLSRSPDTPRFLAEQKLDPNAHIEKGRYVTADSAQALRDTAGQMSADTLRPSLEAADATTPRTSITDLAKNAIAEAQKDPNITALDRETIVRTINKEGAALQRKYPNGMSLTDMHDNKITYAKNGGYSPVKSAADNNLATANRSFGTALGRAVEAKAPEGVPVKDFNAYLSKYYKAADYLDALDTKKIQMGTLSYLANRGLSVVGAVVGHGIGGGILGGVGGYMIGGALEHAIENIPNPMRAAFLRNLEITKPAAYTKVQEYLKSQGQNSPLLKKPTNAQPIPIASRSSNIPNPTTKQGLLQVPKVNKPPILGSPKVRGENPKTTPVLSRENQVKRAAVAPEPAPTAPITPETTKIAPELQPLAQEAQKYSSAEEFVKAFSLELKHGTYYHITDNPNFTINPKLGPRDMVSTGKGSMSEGKLMITSDLRHWAEEYKGLRKYVAVVDMSKVAPKDYFQSNRQFGNEFFVDNPANAKVTRVIPIEQALQEDAKIRAALEKTIPNKQALVDFYNKVGGKKP